MQRKFFKYNLVIIALFGIFLCYNAKATDEGSESLEGPSLQEISSLSQQDIIKEVSKRIFSEEEKMDLDQMGIHFGKQLSKNSLDELLNAYFNETDSNIKGQLRLLIFHVYDPAKKEILKEAYKDPRVKGEEEHKFFFMTLYPILESPTDQDLNPILQFLSEQRIVDGDPYALQKVENIKDTSLLDSILDMNSPHLDSPLAFQIALGQAMSINSPENTKRIKRVLNHVLQNQDSITCQNFAYMLSGAYYDMIQTKAPLNLEAYGEMDNNETCPLNTKWDKKFKENLMIWDEATNDPKRLKKIDEIQSQSTIESEVEGAKSRYAINNEENLDGTVKVKFEDIKTYLSEFRGKEYNSIKDLEKEARRKIKSLGTYPTEENTFEGAPMEWGESLVKE